IEGSPEADRRTHQGAPEILSRHLHLEPETLLPTLTLRHLTDVFSHRDHDRLGCRPLREPDVAVLGACQIQRGNETVGDVVLDAVPFAALVLLAVLGIEPADAAVPLRHRKALAAAGLTFCKSHGSPLHVTDEWDARVRFVAADRQSADQIPEKATHRPARYRAVLVCVD